MRKGEIVQYLRGYYSIVLYCVLSIAHQRLLYKFSQDTWEVNGPLRFLMSYHQGNISLLVTLISVVLLVCALIVPLNRIVRLLVFLSALIFFGLCTSELKVNHNYHFIVYTLFFSLLIPNKENNPKVLSFFTASVFLPFLFSGIYKFKKIVWSIDAGNFSERYLNYHVFSNQILAEIKIIPELTVFSKYIVDHHLVFFPLFYLGIIFQISMFFFVLKFKKYTFVAGILSIFFFFISGFVINAFFEQACLLILYMSFASPNNRYNKIYH